MAVTAQQKSEQSYFVTGKDTTFCKTLKFGTNLQGYLNKLQYTDMNGKNIELKGKKEVPDVITFFVKGIIIDKTPLKADKPDGYIRYTERVVDGKLKVYLAQQGYNSSRTYTPGSPFGDFSTRGPVGIYRFYIKMPDGTYYQINDKGNMRDHIKPFLLSCTDFKNEYKGDFSTCEEAFMEMIKLFNSKCE